MDKGQTDTAVLQHFAKYIESELGIIYGEANFFQLEYRLKDIATQSGLPDIPSLYRETLSGIREPIRSLLLDVATNNETSFFRDASIFRALSKFMLPDLMGKDLIRGGLDLWSAACSTGQEIYSIQMEIEEARLAQPLIPSCRLTATDVSDQALRRAQEGSYSQLEVQRGLPARLLLKYFESEGTQRWKVQSLLRRGVHFQKLNLLEEWSRFGPFHIVFCRNVLIYQSVENKKRVISKIEKLLCPGGFFILGAAESLIGLSEAFEQIEFEGAVFYRKR